MFPEMKIVPVGGGASCGRRGGVRGGFFCKARRSPGSNASMAVGVCPGAPSPRTYLEVAGGWFLKGSTTGEEP